MGAFFGSGSQSNNNSQQSQVDTGRWLPQQPYITQGMGNAQSIYNYQMGQGPYTGQLYAPINSDQTTAVGNGMSTGSGMLSTGQNLINSGSSAATSGLTSAMGTAGALASGNFNPGMTGASTATVGNTANAVSQANQGIGAALGSGQVNNAAITAAGTAAATNPQTQAMINSGLSQIANTLNTSTIPSINAQAVAGGNMDSSRAGAAEGLAQQSADLTGAALTSQIQNNAYNTGAQLAENGQVANLNADLGAASAANGSAGLGISGQSAYNTNNLGLLSTQLGANGQLLTGAQVGNGLTTTGGNLQQTGLGDQYNAGGILQANQQGQDTSNYQQWQNAYNYPWQTLQNYANIAMTPNYGSQSNSSGSSSGSTTNYASGAGALNGMFGNNGLMSMGLGAGLGMMFL